MNTKIKNLFENVKLFVIRRRGFVTLNFESSTCKLKNNFKVFV